METLPCLPVRWAELKPDEFRTRRDACPIAFLPLGLCEPHGHVAALGLDLLKAEYYSTRPHAAVVSSSRPRKGTTFTKPWLSCPRLEEVVGEESDFMAALPPDVVALDVSLSAAGLRECRIKAVIGVSGHSGGSQEDLRRIAGAFTARTRVPVIVASRSRNGFPTFIPGTMLLSRIQSLRPSSPTWFVSAVAWLVNTSPGRAADWRSGLTL